MTATRRARLFAAGLAIAATVLGACSNSEPDPLGELTGADRYAAQALVEAGITGTSDELRLLTDRICTMWDAVGGLNGTTELLVQSGASYADAHRAAIGVAVNRCPQRVAT